VFPGHLAATVVLCHTHSSYLTHASTDLLSYLIQTKSPEGWVLLGMQGMTRLQEGSCKRVNTPSLLGMQACQHSFSSRHASVSTLLLF